jgi:outer membrane protein assembly factor BamB
MSTSNIEMPGTRRPFLRYWLPRLIWGIALVNVLAIWLVPAESFEGGYRLVATVGSLLASYLLFSLWLFIFSGYAWKWRWGIFVLIPLVVAGARFALVQSVHFTGDMTPIVHFRWEESQEQREARLESHRLEQAKHGKPAGISLVSQSENDYPEYRGRKRDGIVASSLSGFDKTKVRQVWKQPCGGGYSGFAVSGQGAVTIEQRGSEEVVVCYEAATGKECWTYSYPAHFKETMGGPGPRATPTIADGDVYSMGAEGLLARLDGASGQEKWRVNILEGNDNLMWGMSGSPLVYDNVVVVNPGAQRESAKGRAVVAYDRETGKEVWTGGDAQAAYASPMLATLAGRRMVLIFDAVGLAGYDAAKGDELWRYPWKNPVANIAQPVVLPAPAGYIFIGSVRPVSVSPSRVFITSGYGHGCALLDVTETNGQFTAVAVWPNTPNPAMHCKFSNPVYYKGFFYGLDDGRLVCVDAATGKRQWKEKDYGHGQLLLAGDKLVILAESGELAVVETGLAKSSQELGKFPALKGEKTWNYPAMVGKRIFVRNHEEMACYDLE